MGFTRDIIYIICLHKHSCLLSALQAKDASSSADMVVSVSPDPSPLSGTLRIIPIIIQSFTVGVTFRERWPASNYTYVHHTNTNIHILWSSYSLARHIGTNEHKCVSQQTTLCTFHQVKGRRKKEYIAISQSVIEGLGLVGGKKMQTLVRTASKSLRV